MYWGRCVSEESYCELYPFNCPNDCKDIRIDIIIEVKDCMGINVLYGE